MHFDWKNLHSQSKSKNWSLCRSSPKPDQNCWHRYTNHSPKLQQSAFNLSNYQPSATVSLSTSIPREDLGQITSQRLYVKSLGSLRAWLGEQQEDLLSGFEVQTLEFTPFPFQSLTQYLLIHLAWYCRSNAAPDAPWQLLLWHKEGNPTRSLLPGTFSVHDFVGTTPVIKVHLTPSIILIPQGEFGNSKWATIPALPDPLKMIDYMTCPENFYHLADNLSRR